MEYHKPALRKLLFAYVRELDGYSKNDAHQILDDDTAFNIAVQTYKHIVTHYLAAKIEKWMSIFMAPIFGVIAAMIVFKFVKTRGAIHYHSLRIRKSEFQNQLQHCLKTFTLSIHYSVEKLNTFIKNAWSDKTHKTKFGVRPDLLICAQKGEEVQMQFCNKSNNQKQRWCEYMEEKEAAITTANKEIGNIMEHNYGVHAMHQGIFPDNWVKPGGHLFEFYLRTQPAMQSSKDFLHKRELKKHKHELEMDLYDREVNIKNHAFTHKCSSYYLRTTTKSSKYNDALHSKVDERNIFETNDGVKMVKYMTEECILGFGEALQFDPTGEQNITCGIKPSI